MLTGAAKIFIRSQGNVREWKSLSSREVHHLLQSRRKRANESFCEYLYSLMETGSPIGLDSESIIGYFIEGIDDDKSNKYALYGAKSINELRDKISIYEKIRTSRT